MYIHIQLLSIFVVDTHKELLANNELHNYMINFSPDNV